MYTEEMISSLEYHKKLVGSLTSDELNELTAPYDNMEVENHYECYFNYKDIVSYYKDIQQYFEPRERKNISVKASQKKGPKKVLFLFQ